MTAVVESVCTAMMDKSVLTESAARYVCLNAQVDVAQMAVAAAVGSVQRVRAAPLGCAWLAAYQRVPVIVAMMAVVGAVGSVQMARAAPLECA